MDPLSLGLLVAFTTILILFSGVSVANGLLIVSCLFLFVFDGFRSLELMPEIFYGHLDNFALLSIPMFIIMGAAISSTASSTINIRGTDYNFDLDEIMKKPSVYVDGCHVNYGEPESGECTYGDINSKTTIVLYGDSHAAQWFPALEVLANERGYKLVSLTKSACPSVDVPRADQGAYKNIHCEKWRDYAIDRIKQLRPEAVIMSSFQYFSPPSGYPSENKWWRDGQIRLLNSLRGLSDHLIYISDTPRPLRDIPNCLASRDSKVCDSTERSRVSVIPGFDVINPNPWLCSSYCPAIVEGTVAYRDASHISVDMALKLLPKLDAALIAKGLFA